MGTAREGGGWRGRHGPGHPRATWATLGSPPGHPGAPRATPESLGPPPGHRSPHPQPLGTLNSVRTAFLHGAAETLRGVSALGPLCRWETYGLILHRFPPFPCPPHSPDGPHHHHHLAKLVWASTPVPPPSPLLTSCPSQRIPLAGNPWLPASPPGDACLFCTQESSPWRLFPLVPHCCFAGLSIFITVFLYSLPLG